MLFQTALALAFIFAGQRVLADSGTDLDVLKACSDSIPAMIHKMDEVGGCCKDYDASVHPNVTMKHKSDVKCSMPGPGEEWKCEHSECALKSHDMLLENGKIDFNNVEKIYDEIIKFNPSTKPVFDAIREKCSEETMPMIAKDCPAKDYFFCTFMVAGTTCQKWKEDETCSPIAEIVTSCMVAVDNMKS